jgi:DNA invertase Pin-like site-specific DNA recombinase
MKAVGYLRCSGLGQISGDTWDRQSESIRAFAADKYTIEREYREEGVPGKTEHEDRPAFKEMVSDLLSNGCRTVIVESMDRLSREYRIQEQLLIYLASKGISLISANTGENITDAMMGDPMRRALVQIQGIFAELDKNMTVAKLSKARKRIRDKGKKCEGKKAFGFHSDKPEEKQTLTLMLALSKHYSAAWIALELNKRGIKPRSGKKWHPNSVARILNRHSAA